MDECKPLPCTSRTAPPVARSHTRMVRSAEQLAAMLPRAATPVMRPVCPASTCLQGLTLVHFSAQCNRFLWGRGCM